MATTNTPLVSGMNSNWYYTWGRTAPADHATRRGEFIPMAWTGSSITNPTNYQQLLGQSSEYIMGFNEPERTDQANMSVATAISLWPQLMATGKKLVSPAVSDNQDGRDWLMEFMSEINRLNYRVDAIAFHWYGDVRGSATGAANGLAGRVDWYHNNFLNNSGQKYPVWLTEFGGLDFTGGVNPVTPAMNEAFLNAALPLLDAKAHLHKYAWFPHRTESSLGSGASPFTPTGAGHIYNGRTYSEGQSYALAGDESADIFYLRGGAIQNTSTTLRTLVNVDAIDGTSEFQGTGKWEVRDGTIRVRSGATLRKISTSNEVDIVNTKIINDGTIIARQGTLRFSAGTVVSGSGTISLVPEGSLALSGTSLLVGSVINNRISLVGGQLFANTGTHILNGELQVTNATSVAMNGALIINQPMSGAAALTKSGSGTLRLNVGSANTGNVSITGGKLLVANAAGSAHGQGLLTIGSTATLTGDGSLGGTGVRIDGTLVPSFTTSDRRPMRFSSPLTFGPTGRAIFDIGTMVADGSNFASVMLDGGVPLEQADLHGGRAVSAADVVLADQIVSLSSVALDGTLELRATFLPNDMLPRTIISAANVSGTFDAIVGLQIPGDPTRAFAVTYAASAVVVTKTLVGDLNIDGVVDFGDVLVMAENYDTTGGGWIGGDVNGDAGTDFADLVMLAGNYGDSLAGVADIRLVLPGDFGDEFAADWGRATVLVPEPSSLSLAAGLMLLQRRRR